MYPEWLYAYIAVTVFVFGAIIGSFLNVVIYRFHTGRSLNGSSHCMSCQTQLRWFELFPLLSYVFLRGKCRTCGSYIPPRYFLVELLTALAFLSVFVHGGTVMGMFLVGVLFALLIVIAVYDLYHYVIPNELIILVSVVTPALYGVKIFEGAPFTIFIPATLSALGAFLFFGGLWKMSAGRWIGFGDVKLAIPLGFLASFPAVFSLVVLSFWVGATVSIVILALQKILKRGQIPLRIFGTPLKMSSEVPFAPFLIAGFVLSYFYGVDVLELVAYVL